MFGWVLMRSVQQLVVQSQDTQPPAISVIVPARNEAHNIVLLIEELRQQIRTTDEIVVVDDGSTDNTLQLAQGAGAKVISAGALPEGWAGKAHACWVGAEAALNDVLVFVDADVRFNTANKHIVRSLASSVVSQPTALFSVQPWHNTVQKSEQASMLFNIVSVMGSGMKTSKPLVFGPLLACMRKVYVANQGHSHASVRGQVVEDIALGRLFKQTRVYLGTPSTCTFRMYPKGFSAVFSGFAKNIAAGAASVPMGRRVLIAAWCASLVGGVVTSPWMYLASLVQVAVFARRVGRFHPLVVALFPVHMLLFTVVVIKSFWDGVLRGGVRWSGRTIRTR
jgi:4,4'-diaponeurosporenoate glycosyltransferase